MWSIIVHGGAGAIDASLRGAHQRGCQAGADAGRAVLEAGGSALDAVCAAVRALEEDPSFNAGYGSAVDADGLVTTDAALMRASDLAYGAVAAVAGVRSPIDLARQVLDDGRHCLLAGPGAVRFARERGIALIDPRRLEADPSRARWWGDENRAAALAKARGEAPGDTVGAAALDARGELAAATSTGGILGKRAGRVGDSPIAGAGLYARSDLGAISGTGHGETFMRTVLAYQALLSVAASREHPAAAMRRELERAAQKIGGRGGLILVLPDGRIAWARSSPHMGVAWASEGRPTAADF